MTCGWKPNSCRDTASMSSLLVQIRLFEVSAKIYCKRERKMPNKRSFDFFHFKKEQFVPVHATLKDVHVRYTALRMILFT